MKRFVAVLVGVGSMLALAASVGAARADTYHESLCQERPFMCLDPYKSIGTNGEYTGHDEPTVQFMSHRPGTGNDLTYVMQLPKEPPKRPTQDAKGGTWNFQLRATFWLSNTVCDTQSWPNFRDTCKPNTDFNARFRSLDRESRFNLGKGPGQAFLEVQFYAPGWVPQFAGFGCSAHKWCANMTIDSLSDQPFSGATQNEDCLDNHFLVGEEPINWAYVTKSGKSQAPANPLFLSDDPSFKGLNPDLQKDLLMNGGDFLRVHLHDTAAGYRVDITDLTTHQHGSMTASKGNGFGQIMFQPKAKQCHVRPYAFHSMYSSAVRRGTTWAAHTTNIGVSDEIGHFEYCDAIDPSTGSCTNPGGADSSLDEDDQACLDGSQFGALIPIIGCVLDDGDFDGPSYLRDWPGTWPNPAVDQRFHPTPWRFTVPTSHGRPLDHVAFESDLPRIERGEPANHQPECDAKTGAHCVNPPVGARFYPIYTLGQVNDLCMFQQGGTHIPGTTNTFGGSSKTEYGTQVHFVRYPTLHFRTERLAEDFRRDLHGNPCR